MRRNVLCVMAVWAAACYTLAGCEAADSEGGKTSASASAETEYATEIEAWGEVKYNTVCQLNIDFPAVVETIAVKEGDVVHKGDILATLDTTEFDNSIAKLEAQKAAGEAALTGLAQDTSGLEAQIAQMESEIADAADAVKNYQVLYDGGSVSKDALDQLVSKKNALETDRKVLQTQLEQTKKSNTSSIDQQTGSLAAIEKDLETYRSKREKPYLTDGSLVCNLDRAIVKSISVETGSLLGTAGTTAMELIDADSIYVSAEVDEEFIKDISMDSHPRIVPTMNPETKLTGYVSQIAAMAVEKDGNRIIKIQVIPEDPEGLLKPGYTADVYFTE